MKKHLFSTNIFLLFIFIVGFNASALAKPPEWLRKVKRIELLKTSRAEVEKLFDNPQVVEIDDLAVQFKNGYGKLIKYETKYGKLEVWYAAGKCSENKGKPYAYDIAADAAAMVTFFPNEIVLENQLGYDLSKFVLDSDSETDKTYSLESEKFKVTVEVENFQVVSLEYDIAEEHKTRLECKNFKVKEPVWLEKLRTLEILKSTRGDVESLFENPRISEINDTVENGDDWSIEVEYETIDGTLKVEYSTGKCFERQSKNGYDAAKDTLIEMTFLPREKTDPTEINYDLRKIRDGLGDELGVSVERRGGEIFNIRFYPSEKQEAEFDCEKIFNSQK